MPSSETQDDGGELMADPYDPTDDDDVPADVLDVDESDPVDLVEDPEGEVAIPPEGWAQDLTDEDWAERLQGADVTRDPEDGKPGEGTL